MWTFSDQADGREERRWSTTRRRTASGSGMPVTGMIPMVMPTFSKTWNTSIDQHPDADERAEQVRASVPVRQIRQTITA